MTEPQPPSATPDRTPPPAGPPPGDSTRPGPPGGPDAGTAVTQPVTWTQASSFPEPAEPRAAPPATTAGPSSRRSVGPGFIVAAVLATAVLTSGGTYLAVSAANGNRAATTPAPAFLPAVAPGTMPPANGGTTPNENQATPAPATPAAPAAPATGQGSVVDIVKAVSPAVVTITAEGVTANNPITGQSGQGTATGSGFIFDSNGLILTNHHVVAGNPSKLTVTLKDGRSFDATVYGIDTLTDLAIVRVNQAGLPTAPIGDSASIQVGQQAIAIGSPLGEFTDSVTSGIISAIGREIQVEDGTTLTNLIQTDTAINPGNSGGPLLDGAGQVIGINTAVAGDAQGIGFAIPIDIARPLLAQASAGQQLARPWLGIRFKTIDPQVKKAANLPVDNGAWIPTAAALSQDVTDGNQDPNASPDPNGQDPFNGLDPFGNGFNPFGNGNPFGQGQGGQATTPQPSIVDGSPAQAAGLVEGDIITAVNGTALDATRPLDLAMSQLSPGQTATLTVLRDGQTLTIPVTLGTRPADL